MGIFDFDKLKHIIKFDIKDAFKGLIQVNQTDNSKHIEVNLNLANILTNTNKYVFSEDKKICSINVPQLSLEEKQLLRQLIKDDFEADNIYLMERSSAERVEDIKRQSGVKENLDLLEFYKGKILSEHLEALEASLYMRTVFRRGGNVWILKGDIIKRFGDDGRNISNLCTGNYFEGFIKQVYEEMSSAPDFTMDKFQKHFTTIVRTEPFAVFASRGKSEAELSGEIIYKLGTFQKYGAEYLAIHGIGKDNIEKIRLIVKEIEEQQALKQEINQEGNIILVKIFLGRHS